MKKNLSCLYVAYPGEKKHKGLKKKIDGQIEAMERMGIKVTYFEPKISNRYGVIFKIARRLPIVSINPMKFSVNNLSEYNIIYIRYFLADKRFLEFLKLVKENNPKTKIVIEFFDWPYEAHYHNLKEYLLLLKDLSVRKYYKRYVDRVITYTKKDELLGIRSLHTKNNVNGIDIRKIQMRKPIDNGIIDIVTVSIMKSYHGYDRLIRGLGEYYANGGTREIILHMVGDGPERLAYEKLAKECRIESRVIFYGFQYGNDLDLIYDKSDIAVTSLGMYRLNSLEGSFIKTSEYLAKGLPIITGCKISLLEDTNFKYYCEFANNNSNIDFQEVVEFFDKIYFTKNSFDGTCNEIRNFAMQECDTEAVMKPIIDYLLQ